MEKQEQQNERIERETCPKKEKFFVGVRLRFLKVLLLCVFSTVGYG